LRIPIFLSYPKPHVVRQQTFIEQFEKYLRDRGLEPRTLGVTDYDMDAPLKAIRRLMLESNGLVTIAFRRTLIIQGKSRPAPDIGREKETELNNIWLTSPYCQIEPAMAYQLGLPILILRESGVRQEGLLEKGVVGIYMPEFTLDGFIGDPGYLESSEWCSVIGKWEGRVRSVVEKKGSPPPLY
jgi:hypothetical protein